MAAETTPKNGQQYGTSITIADLGEPTLKVVHSQDQDLIAQGADAWRFWDAIGNTSRETLTVQALYIHGYQRFRLPDDKESRLQLVQRDAAIAAYDGTVCESANGIVGTKGLRAGEPCDVCEWHHEGYCRRGWCVYARIMDADVPFTFAPRRLYMTRHSGNVVKRLWGSELRGAPIWSEVWTLRGEQKSWGGGRSAAIIEVVESRAATKDEVAAAEAMREQLVLPHIAQIMPATTVSIGQLAAAKEPLALLAASAGGA